MDISNHLLEVRGLCTDFFTSRGIFKAVDGVSFTLDRGEALGLVGESGCGKTITCLSILRLVPEPMCRIVSGQVLFEGEDLLRKKPSEMRKIRGNEITMILQDPMTALNPVFSIGAQVCESIGLHQNIRGKKLWQRGAEMLKLVRIPSARAVMNSYPHQLSGGMRQRVAGAIAFACKPKLLIADEPTTSLDATIQAQYLALLKDLQKQSQAALIFVSHDFNIVERMCTKIAVMYAGQIVEIAPSQDLFDNPAHPYTKALLQAVPRIDAKPKRLVTIEGQPPALRDLPTGCRFGPRCSYRMARCPEGPHQVSVGENHWVRCWLYV